MVIGTNKVCLEWPMSIKESVVTVVFCLMISQKRSLIEVISTTAFLVSRGAVLEEVFYHFSCQMVLMLLSCAPLVFRLSAGTGS